MKFTWPNYPSPWRWRFALIPVYFGAGRWLWWEFYQIRSVNCGSWERRDRSGEVVSFCVGPY